MQISRIIRYPADLFIYDHITLRGTTELDLINVP